MSSGGEDPSFQENPKIRSREGYVLRDYDSLGGETGGLGRSWTKIPRRN